MIFRQWQQVLDGTKTQTRRLWHDTDYTWMCGRRGAHPAPLLYSQINMQNGRIRYRVGQLLPVIPKRGQAAIRVNGQIARVEVVGLWREPVQNISEADAVAEGVSSVEEYRALWESINGKTKGARWADDPLVTVIMFEFVKVSDQPLFEATP